MSPYSGLEFSVSEFRTELQELERLARQFLDPTTSAIVYELRERLRYIARQPHGSPAHVWEIPQDRPIRTELSEGKYQAGGKGKYTIYGEVCFIWEIAPSGKQDKFVLVGNASTKCSIRSIDHYAGKVDELAAWRVDIGVGTSPGGHFHIQVPWQLNGPEELKTLDVPRFPSLLVSPMDAVEFLLGELFQESWAKHVLEHRDIAGLHSKKVRFERLMDWHREIVTRSRASPVLSLKQGKPRMNVFQP